MCNGWTNRATWLVNLHFGEELTGMDADTMKDYVSEFVDEQLAGVHCFVTDLIDLSEINWEELAEHHREDEDDDDEADTEDDIHDINEALRLTEDDE